MSTLQGRFLYIEQEIVTQRNTEKSQSFTEEFLEFSLCVSAESLRNFVLLFGSGLARLG